MLPFLGNDSRYSLTAGEVHQLPLGRRVGVVSISPREVMLAFVGSDASWTGGRSMSLHDSIHRGGLTITLVGIGKNRSGRAVAEFEVLTCPDAVRPKPAGSGASATSPVSPIAPAAPVVAQQSPA